MRNIDVRKFDFNLLRALDVLLHERNVTRAANELHVTQQAMSGSLKRLRHHFDDELLMRVGHHLEPTPLALALVEPVRDAILQIELALETAPVFSPELTKRHFRVAMSDHASLTLLPHLMAYLAHRSPSITFEIRPVDKDGLYDLDVGNLDFCIFPQSLHLYQSGSSDCIRTMPLFTDDFVCVVDRNNPDVGRTLTLDQYVTMRHTAMMIGGGVRSLVEDAWLLNNISPPIAATASNFSYLISMIPGTPLIATVHRRVAMRFKQMLPIRLLKCPFKIDCLQQQLNWHMRYDKDPAHRFVRQAFVSASAEMH